MVDLFPKAFLANLIGSGDWVWDRGTSGEVRVSVELGLLLGCCGEPSLLQVGKPVNSGDQNREFIFGTPGVSRCSVR